MTGSSKPKLAIIGAGSSGLISLKTALELLPGWETTCYEATHQLIGAWGNPYSGFVSTSTKYTTQFSCYPKFDASVSPEGRYERRDFFRNGEYGDYLNEFATHFSLRDHILFGHKVLRVIRCEEKSGWNLTIEPEDKGVCTSHFDAVIICTGLVSQPKALGDLPNIADLRQLCSSEGMNSVHEKKVVIIGGGEMATDFANRLSEPELKNEVYLSLRSGVRVSPRYHPIRGVPSDFLRNRLMLSIHEDIRNWIGRRFVSARIRYQKWFEKLFPASNRNNNTPDSGIYKERKKWGKLLNGCAKHGLFDMFHNKSDDFLTAVAEGRLNIIGPSTNESLTEFKSFDQSTRQKITPDVIVPAVGFRSKLGELLGDNTNVSDFYRGCCHHRHDDLFLVGFARPVIGNIPSISEIQARYVIKNISKEISRPANISERTIEDASSRKKRFGSVDTQTIYPVEMFPYCDQLARDMNEEPKSRSWIQWWNQQTAPASTLDYSCFDEARRDFTKSPTYMPLILIMLLFALKPTDWLYRIIQRKRN